MAAYPPAAGGRFVDLLAVLSASAVVVLAVGLAVGWAPLVPSSVVLAGGSYAAMLLADGREIDAVAALVAGGLVLAAELAYGAIEDDPARLWSLGVGAGAAVVAALVLSTAGMEVAGGLVLEIAGVAAAVAALALLAVLARRYG